MIIKKDQYTVTVTKDTYIGLLKEMGGIKLAILVFIVFLLCEFSNMSYGRLLGAWIAGTFDR